jgi:hypothetical protein
MLTLILGAAILLIILIMLLVGKYYYENHIEKDFLEDAASFSEDVKDFIIDFIVDDVLPFLWEIVKVILIPLVLYLLWFALLGRLIRFEL